MIRGARAPRFSPSRHKRVLYLPENSVGTSARVLFTKTSNKRSTTWVVCGSVRLINDVDKSSISNARVRAKTDYHIYMLKLYFKYIKRKILLDSKNYLTSDTSANIIFRMSFFFIILFLTFKLLFDITIFFSLMFTIVNRVAAKYYSVQIFLRKK